MPRKTREEFLKGWNRRRGAEPEPSHTDKPKDVSQMSSEELADAIKDQEQRVRVARERELAAYQAEDAGEESKTTLADELHKRGYRLARGHF